MLRGLWLNIVPPWERQPCRSLISLPRRDNALVHGIIVPPWETSCCWSGELAGFMHNVSAWERLAGRRLSQGGTLRGPISPEQGRCAAIAQISGRKAGVLPSRDVARSRSTIVPPWEGRARCMRVFLPTRGVVRSHLTIVLSWERRACRACEKRRCRVRALVPSRAAMRAALGVPLHPAPPRSPKGLKLAEAYLLRSGCIAQCADAGAGIL